MDLYIKDELTHGLAVVLETRCRTLSIKQRSKVTASSFVLLIFEAWIFITLRIFD